MQNTFVNEARFGAFSFRGEKSFLVLAFLVCTAFHITACASTSDSVRVNKFVGTYVVSREGTGASPQSILELSVEGKANASGKVFEVLNRECVSIYWSPDSGENEITLGCSNLNQSIVFAGKDTLTVDRDNYKYTKGSVAPKVSDAVTISSIQPEKPEKSMADMIKADEALIDPVMGMNAQKARDYIKRHNLLKRLQTDQYRNIAIARIKGAEADDLEFARRKKVGGIPTNGRLGGGFRGYTWGTSMQIIREKHQGLIIHDEGNTIKVEVDGTQYRFYFYEDFLASVEIVPADIQDHTNLFDQLRRSFGKPTVKKQHRDKSSNRRGDQFAWKRHEVVWDDGTTAISMQHCEVEYDPLNAGCMINPEFSSIISYDSKKLTKLLMEKLEKERKAKAPF